MNMRKRVATAIMALGMSFGAFAQDNNIETLVSTDSDNSRARINLYSDLPFGFTGYTFAELKGDGYFLRNITSKKIKGPLEVRVDTKHSNRFDDHYGAGLQVKGKVPGGKGMLASQVWADKKGFKKDLITLMGAYFATKGYKVKDKEMIAKLTAFAEYNLAKNQWGYGEINVSTGKKDGKWLIGAGVDLYNQGKVAPKPVPRASIMYNF